MRIRIAQRRDTDADSTRRFALVVFLSYLPHGFETHMSVRASILWIKGIGQTERVLHSAGVEGYSIRLTRLTFVHYDGQLPGVTTQPEVTLHKGGNAAFLLCESAENQGVIKIHGEVPAEKVPSTHWNGTLAPGQDFDFHLRVWARYSESRRWADASCHYVLRFDGWDSPVLRREIGGTWRRIRVWNGNEPGRWDKRFLLRHFARRWRDEGDGS